MLFGMVWSSASPSAPTELGSVVAKGNIWFRLKLELELIEGTLEGVEGLSL
jgi:hypothetical protein